VTINVEIVNPDVPAGGVHVVLKQISLDEQRDCGAVGHVMPAILKTLALKS
jgi:hypothetical protein